MEVPLGDVRHAQFGGRPFVERYGVGADNVAFLGQREFDAELGLAKGRDLLVGLIFLTMEIARRHADDGVDTRPIGGLELLKTFKKESESCRVRVCQYM